MAGKWVKAGVPVLIVVGAVVLASAFVAGKKPPEQKKKSVKNLFVEVKPVSLQNLTYQVWSQGPVQPKVVTSLTSEVNGVIVKIADNFIEGGFFRAGDLLIQVEQYDYLTAVKLSEANLARAQALLEEEKARGKVAAEEWSSFSAGKAPELGLRRPQLAQELANVRSAEAELENARRNLIRTEIRAPYDGIVKLKNANIGQFISRGFNLGTIYGTDVAEVRLPLSDNDVGYLNMPGLTPSEQQQPEVVLSAEVAGQQLNWNARLVRTEGMLDDENRVIYAVAEIKDPYRLKAQGEAPLRFGRFVKARIDGKNGDNLVLVERHLLKPDQKVLTISKDNKLHIRSVTVQRMDEEYAYISAGLDSGEQLVLTAIANPLEGMALRTSADTAVDDAEKEKSAIAATESGEKTLMQPLDQTHKGWLAWFARNSVASNLLMVILLLAGIASVFTIKKQTFPEIQLEQVTIRVAYLGAAPQEVEEGIVDKIEESLRSLNGIKKIRSNAVEGLGTVNVEIQSGYDIQEVMNEIKMQVDSISSFPEQTERPVVYNTKFQSNVLWLSVYGDTDQRGLKEFAKDVRDELKKLPGVSKVEVVGALDYEVSIEVSEHKLREYGLTFDQMVAAVRGSSVDLPGGSIKADNGNILLRAKGQAYRQQDFADIVLINRADGTRLLLGDIAQIKDGFVEMESFSTFNGKPSVSIKVDAVGEDNTLKIAAVVKDYVVKKKTDLPDSMNIDYWGDSSYYLQGRLDLMTDNMLMGALLVLISLTLFLEFRVAFWVMVGIPVCFLGTIALMPLSMFDVSINMISLFGFILVLGILVDDAIIIGESAYTEIEKYGKSAETVIRGAQRVAMPATFGVMTTIAAFIPMLMVGGPQGPIWESIAWVVILCLIFSMVESKFILPAHLIAMDSKPWDPQRKGLFYGLGRSCSNGLKFVRLKVSGATDRFVFGRYKRAIEWCIEYRYITATSFFAMMVLMIGLMAGGHVRWVFFPNIPSDFINANLTMMEGSSGKATVQAMQQLEAALVKTNEQIVAKGEEGLVKHRLSFTESDTRGELVIELEKSEGRNIDANEFVRLWREQIPEIAGIKTLQIFSSTSGGGGGDISFQLKSKELDQLRLATEELKAAMVAYQGVYDIEDSISGGNDEIVLKIKPEAEALGITLSDLATQVRHGFYGAEAQRIQRDGEEVKVMVRYPKEERRSVGNLENMKIRTASGAEVPFSQVAEYKAQPSYSAINRVDGERSVTISASVDKALAEPMKITKELQEKVLPKLAAKYGIETALEGASLEEADAMTDLALGFLLALFVIYALLAIPLKSYTQPLIIMSVIPFGLIGAILGHMLLGLSVSIMSLFGLIALAGVVVNDSLVMVDFVNESRRNGMPLKEAVVGAGTRRFRPIMLTSLTTFLGLAPIVLEKSLQAQIVVPMAVSLAYGILFATVITLILIPALYVILNDFLGLFGNKKPEETSYPVNDLPLQK